MTRKTTTVMLENAECAGGSAHTVEKALQRVPGVLRAYVNPATEAAYVEYDADRCNEADLESAVESLGVHPLHAAAGRQPAMIPLPPSSARLPMRDTDTQSTRSRSWWAFAGFIAIAGFFLFTEHRAHLFGILPFLFLLACPFLHIFGHSGHGGHGGRGGQGGDAREDDIRHSHQASGFRGEPRSSGGDQRPSGATRDDWRS